MGKTVTKNKMAIGLAGELFAHEWLASRKFHIIKSNLKIAHPLQTKRAIQIDLLAYSQSKNCYYCVEVKTHQAWQGPLLSPTQRQRLYLARQVLATSPQFKGSRIVVTLLWIDPVSKVVEFIENP